MSQSKALPLSFEDLQRAADNLVAEHGGAAAATARARAEELRSQGFEALALTWQLIEKAVRSRLGAAPVDGSAYLEALRRGVFLSE